MIKTYYRLMKPGIIYGNALMYAAGFFLASRHGIAWPLFFEGLAGLSLIIGSACVFNNVADRELDAKMPRTQKRALVTGIVSPQNALAFGVVLVLLGSGLLLYFSTILSLCVALVGFFVYVFLYTPLKPKSKWALFVGAVAGATPPVVGYVAVTGVLDWWAVGLFIALFLWQLPHFIAIATYRYEDYAKGGVPLFARQPRNENEKKIARGVFVASLIVLLLACLGVALWRLFF